MPQSRLPDINTAFNTHRKRAIIAIEMENWTEALGALSSINAALPLEYRVIISDQKYNDLTKQDLLATCTKCKEQVDYKDVRIMNVLTTPLQKFISQSKTVKIWQCPKCHQDNRLSETPIEQTVLAQPYYLGVISPPPKRTDDLTSHVRYDKILERWCWTMLAELEQKMAQYRDDNWDRGESDEFYKLPVDTTQEDKEQDDSG